MIRLPLLSHACPGQCEDKLRPNLLCADHINSFPVILDDLFYNGQPQTGSLFIFSTGQICLVETIPDQSYKTVPIFFSDSPSESQPLYL